MQKQTAAPIEAPRWLLSYVVVTDPETREAVAYGPGDRAGVEIPTEHAERITNPKVWSGGTTLEWDGNAGMETPVDPGTRPTKDGRRRPPGVQWPGDSEFLEVWATVKEPDGSKRPVGKWRTRG